MLIGGLVGGWEDSGFCDRVVDCLEAADESICSECPLLTSWLVVWLVGWLVGRLVGGLVGGLVGWLVGGWVGGLSLL